MFDVITFWLLTALLLGSAGYVISCNRIGRCAIGLAVFLVFLAVTYALMRSFVATIAHVVLLIVGLGALWAVSRRAGAAEGIDGSKISVWWVAALLPVLFIAGKFGRLLFPVAANLVGSPITLNHFLLLAFLVFLMGLLGIIIRRHPVRVIMAIQLLFGGGNLALVSSGRFHGTQVELGLFAVNLCTALAVAAVGTTVLVVRSRRAGLPGPAIPLEPERVSRW